MTTTVMLAIEALRSMTREQLEAMAKASVKIARAAKTAQSTYTSSFPATGKLLYVISEKLEKSELALTLTEHFKAVTGEKPPSHAFSCYRCMKIYVAAGLITEATYDNQTSGALETAASIGSAVGGDLTNPVIAEAAKILNDNAKDQAKIKALKVVLEKVKPKDPMTEEKALVVIDEVLKDGHVLATLNETIAALPGMKDDEEAMKNAYQFLQIGIGHIPDALVKKWVAEAKAETERLKAEAKAAAAKAKKPDSTPAPAQVPTP